MDDRTLECDAGGGDQDRVLRPALCRPALAMQDAGGQVGEGLADAGPRVAQGDAAIQHGVQHLMAQFHLCRTLHHPVSREQVLEDMVDILVRVFPVVTFFHHSNPHIICLVTDRLTAFAARPPVS